MKQIYVIIFFHIFIFFYISSLFYLTSHKSAFYILINYLVLVVGIHLKKYQLCLREKYVN